MNSLKKVISSPVFSVVSILLAGGLLFFAGIGGARSALQYYSDNYGAQMDVHDIGVTLIENDKPISWRNYEGEGKVDYNNKGEDERQNWETSTGLKDGEGGEYDELLRDIPGGFQLGTKYDEVLKVQNSGTVDQYVRVIIHKYWLDESNKKIFQCSREQRDLHFDEEFVGDQDSDKDWIIDTYDYATQNERIILYYTKLLKVKETSTPITDYFQIDSDLGRTVSQDIKKEKGKDGKEYTTITTTYEYDGAKFCVEAKVDAVQDHHAEDAILSAWGRRVKINNGRLSLVKEQIKQKEEQKGGR